MIVFWYTVAPLYNLTSSISATRRGIWCNLLCGGTTCIICHSLSLILTGAPHALSAILYLCYSQGHHMHCLSSSISATHRGTTCIICHSLSLLLTGAPHALSVILYLWYSQGDHMHYLSSSISATHRGTPCIICHSLSLILIANPNKWSVKTKLCNCIYLGNTFFVWHQGATGRWM